VGRGFELTPWLGRCADYRPVEGVRLPHHIDATWLLPLGPFEWLQAGLEEIRYSF
jgi:hypothetical protein